ncbi:hypothetical protein AGOR_G00049530 [Albula goreensis]|uniref:Uncharacterized protein n=1 Tax=Albula goreensis TaxID=1534307 RepID=A0A8T3DYE0_9TELE|nr:hypothetical protein AGOR_G00049530 [Albula goreensis]
MPPATPKSRAKRGRISTSPGPLQVQNPDTGDVIPGRLTKSEWVAMLVREEGEEAVASILDDLMSHVMERCYKVYLQNQLIPFTVSKAKDTLVKVVEWEFLMQDKGEGPGSTPLWVEDTEPQPCRTDSWAQGSVPVWPRSPASTTFISQADPNGPKPRQTKLPVGKAATAGPIQKAHSESQAKLMRDNTSKHQKDWTVQPNVPGTKPPGLSTASMKKRREMKGKLSLQHQAGLPALKTPPPHLFRQVLASRVSTEEEDLMSPLLTGTPLPRPPDIPPVKRLNPSCLPRRYLCPGFEVLKSSSEQPASRKKGGRKLQAPTQCREFPEDNLIGPPTRPVCVFSTRAIQDGRQTQGFIPISVGLLLDHMKLSPGVCIRDPPWAPTSSLTGHPSQIKLRGDQ